MVSSGNGSIHVSAALNAHGGDLDPHELRNAERNHGRLQEEAPPDDVQEGKPNAREVQSQRPQHSSPALGLGLGKVNGFSSISHGGDSDPHEIRLRHSQQNLPWTPGAPLAHISSMTTASQKSPIVPMPSMNDIWPGATAPQKSPAHPITKVSPASPNSSPVASREDKPLPNPHSPRNVPQQPPREQMLLSTYSPRNRNQLGNVEVPVITKTFAEKNLGPPASPQPVRSVSCKLSDRLTWLIYSRKPSNDAAIARFSPSSNQQKQPSQKRETSEPPLVGSPHAPHKPSFFRRVCNRLKNTASNERPR